MRQPKIAELLKMMPAGTAVYVTKDDGTEVCTVTESEPWQLGHGVWVVKLRGFGAGGYDLARVRAPYSGEVHLQQKGAA